MKKAAILFFFIVFAAGTLLAQTTGLRVHYKVSFDSAAKNKMHVDMIMDNLKPGELTCKMPQWMPGYYQIMNYANNVSDLVIKDEKNKIIPYNFQRKLLLEVLCVKAHIPILVPILPPIKLHVNKVVSGILLL